MNYRWMDCSKREMNCRVKWITGEWIAVEREMNCRVK